MRQYNYKSKPGLLHARLHIEGMVTSACPALGAIVCHKRNQGGTSMLCLKKKKKEKDERRNSYQIKFLIPMQMLPEPRACRAEVVFGGLGQSLDY